MADALEKRKPVFTGNEGEIILDDDAKKIKEPHQKKKGEISRGGDNYVEAEFFGINQFNKLIAPYGDKCVGFRVYHGSTWENHKGKEVEVTQEGKGKRTARVVIVPVDQYGNDLRPAIGSKDPDGSGLAKGPLCPSNCKSDTN